MPNVDTKTLVLEKWKTHKKLQGFFCTYRKLLGEFLVLVETFFARFLHSFSNFWFGGPLGSIKHENLGVPFFGPP